MYMMPLAESLLDVTPSPSPLISQKISF
ncbi:hypothetical protein NC651_003123 [Populus alba x Populus x berolinensis]|nr:hypothetical protein NC651_003123 [Populus alba x Populus x berolinensis]